MDARRTGRWISVALIAMVALLVLPGLGSGLWEPTEVAAADAARGGGRGTHPPLLYALQAGGFRALGVREVAARLPVALAALGCVALTAWIGMLALGRRAGLLGALVLATSPALLFDARLVSSEVLVTTAGLAAWGGVMLLHRVPLALSVCMSLLGLGVGALAGGLVVGAALPMLASGLTLLLAESLERTRNRSTIATALLLLGLSAATVALLFGGSISAVWLGGALRKVTVPPSFDTALKSIAFGAFPWSGLLPVALLHLLSPSRPSTLARVQLLAVLSAAFCLALLMSWRVHEIRTPALVACAMAVGVYLDDVLRGEAGGPFAALLAACGVAILARDLFLSPETFLDAQRLEGLKYPALVGVQIVHLCVGLAFALAAWVGLRWWKRALFALFVLAVPYAAFAAHGLMPALGTHFSSKGLLVAYQKVARAGEPLAQFRMTGKTAAFGVGGEPRELRTQPQLLEYLRAPGRVFVLVPAADLAALDQAARRADTRYHVIDDSSSRAVLLSNRLGKGERDHNPLRRFVFREPTRPRHRLRANFDGVVELVGFDMPASADRGGRFRVQLHFHVTGKLPANWKLFLHFDGPATRVHGDHLPLDGKLPTQYWSVGDYIVDEYDVEVPRMTTSRGRYTAHMGFWLGEKRLKVVDGPHDGADRVRLGTLQLR